MINQHRCRLVVCHVNSLVGRKLTMIILAGVLALVATQIGSDPVHIGDRHDPFQAALITPPSVRLYLHIHDAASLRAEVSDRPFAKWASNFLSKGQMPQAWDNLAEVSQLEGAELFDTLLGKSLTLVVRNKGESTQWAILTEVDPEQTKLMLANLQPRVLAPRHRLAIMHLPEFELLLAHSGRMLLVGPTPQSGLFDEMVPNLSSPPSDCLANQPAFEEARQLGGGEIGLYMKHDQPMGGWSVAVARFDSPHMNLRYAAKFDNAPFTRAPTKLNWDLSPIHNFRERTALAIIEPTNTASGQFDAFLQVVLGPAAYTPAMRQNLGPRQITTIAELDGLMQKPAFDLMLPIAARIREVKDPEIAWDHLDQQLIGLAKSVNELGEGQVSVLVPDPSTFKPGQPRQIKFGSAAKWLFGDIPGLEQLTLNWSVVEGPLGAWSVVATDSKHLEEITASLTNEPVEESNIGVWESCGLADGPRLASLTRSWGSRADVLAEPEDVEALRKAFLLLSDFGQGVEKLQWQMKRPAPDRVRLDAKITFSPPDSSR